MEDIIFIDKPKGITSFDVIRKLRRIFNIKKMGFAGTLDPAATGLMIVGIEKGTKKLTEFAGLDKVYSVDILLGIATDSGDLDGVTIDEISVEKIDEGEIKQALKELTGKIKITVPIYSAVKINGKRLYQYAREGKDVNLPQREVEIYDIRYDGAEKTGDKYIIRATIHCQKGTYIRSIAEELGKKLSLPATVKELRRIKIGQYTIEDARRIEDLEAEKRTGQNV